MGLALPVLEEGEQTLVLLLCAGGDPDGAGSSTQGLNLAVAEAGRTRGSELLDKRLEAVLRTLPGDPCPGSKG